jgi:CRISPR type III-A-associated protein Csm2
MPIDRKMDIENVDYNTIRDWINKDIIPKVKASKNDYFCDLLDIDNAILYAQILARNLEIIKTHQLRRFFSAIKNIQNKVNLNKDLSDGSDFPPEEYAELQMLRPQLANAVGRLRGKERAAMQSLLDVFNPIFVLVKRKNDFVRFTNFFESIVAYHKAYAKE